MLEILPEITQNNIFTRICPIVLIWYLQCGSCVQEKSIYH